MFKEFTEYPNPEETDYDITSSTKESEEINQYILEIIDMVGFLEDGEWQDYGLTEEEYLNPTEETVNKVRTYLEKHNQEPLVGIKR